MKRVYVFICLVIPMMISGQKKWNGGDTGSWQDAANWIPEGVPTAGDKVVLDNSLHEATYVVTLPVSAVTVESLVISPAAGRSVSVVLPKENTSTPALVLTDAKDALVIDSGGVFLNASGLTSGTSISCAGSIRINNGGRYIHSSRSIHATDIVAKLSSAEGTAQGIFEFDVPAASTTVSLSNRVFGKLLLSSSANGGNVSYNGSGVNPLLVRSDLEIGPGVNFSISFSATVTVMRNLVQKGGIFNIANAAANTHLSVEGDIIQDAGTITKTGAGLPAITLGGMVKQRIAFRGQLTGNILLRINNAKGVELQSPVALPYRLELAKGVIKTSAQNLLTLLPGCTVAVDSTGGSFVDGPLRKEGLLASTHFLFPVGKQTRHRWLALKNASGSFVVEYENENPATLSTWLGESLHHISTVERWQVVGDELPIPVAQVELSFDHVNSGGVSDLNTLKVSQLADGRWNDAGNILFTGTAGTAGSVVSESINRFDKPFSYYTLASSVAGQNTLPLEEISFGLKRREDGLVFNFTLSDDMNPDHFILQGSSNGRDFIDLAEFSATPFEGRYLYFYGQPVTERYFRLVVVSASGSLAYSKVVYDATAVGRKIALYPSVVQGKAMFSVYSTTGEQVEMQVTDMSGKVISRKRQYVKKGNSTLELDTNMMAKGVYLLRTVFSNSVEVVRFIKY